MTVEVSRDVQSTLKGLMEGYTPASGKGLPHTAGDSSPGLGAAERRRSLCGSREARAL